MHFEEEVQGDTRYLVASFSEGESLDTTSYEMLTNNELEGVISPLLDQFDDCLKLRYDVSGCVSLAGFMTDEVEKKRMIALLEGVTTALDVSKDYLLPLDGYALDEQHVYVDAETGCPRLVYVPVVPLTTPCDPCSFFRGVVANVKSTGDVSYVGLLLSYLNGDGFTLERFSKMLTTASAPGGRRREDTATSPTSRAQERIPEKPVSQPVPQPAPQPPVAEAQAAGPGAVATPAAPVQQPVSQPAFPQPLPIQPQAQAFATPPAMPQPIPGSEPPAKKGIFGGLSKDKKPREKKAPKEKRGPKKEKKEKDARRGSLFGKKGQPGDKVPTSPGYAVSDFGFAAPGVELRTAEELAAQAASEQRAAPVNSARNAASVEADFGVTVVYPNEEAALASAAVPAPSPSPTPSSVPTPLSAPVPVPPVDAPTSAAADDNPTSPWPDEAAGSDAPTMLGVSPQAWLRQEETGTEFEITGLVCVLGRSASKADVCVSSNKEVSKCHAKVTFDGAAYWIEDLESLNHTYVDGHQLQPGQRVQLADGSVIRLSGEKFVFHL